MRSHPARGALSRLALAVATLGAAGALALAPASVASAHDYVVSSDPAAGATVTTALTQVSLTFNDVVLDLSGDGESSIVQVTGEDGRHFETGCATADGRVVTAPVALGAAGSYRMAWQIVSADGHTVSENLDFTYEPPEGAPEAKGTANRPECGASGGGSTAAATAGPTAPTAAASDGDNLGIVIGLAGGIVALALIAVIIVLVTARRKPRGPATWEPDKD